MEMNKRETKVTWLDVILALLAGTVIVAGILCIAQTIWSGYHGQLTEYGLLDLAS